MRNANGEEASLLTADFGRSLCMLNANEKVTMSTFWTSLNKGIELGGGLSKKSLVFVQAIMNLALSGMSWRKQNRILTTGNFHW